MMGASVINIFILLSYLGTEAFGDSIFPDYPVLSSDAVTGVVKGGSEVNLFCRSASNGAAQWLHNNQTLSTDSSLKYRISDDSFTLKITSFQNSLNHNGDYRCVKDGLLSNIIQLNKARIKSFGSDLEDIAIDVVVGNTAVIPCQPPASRPDALTVFEFGGDTIDESRDRFLLLYNVSQQKHYLHIHPVQLLDSGTYRCVAINTVTGKKVSSPNNIKLNVIDAVEPVPPTLIDFPEKDKRVSAIEGNTIILPCALNGYPVPSVVWEKYDSSLPVNRTRNIFNNLVIEDVEPSDAGTYQCLAENSASNTPTVEVFVLDVKTKPIIAARPAAVTSDIGGSVTFKCPVITAGIPEATVEWYFNGRRILPDGNNIFVQETPDSDLIIREAQEANTGVYQCIVYNEAGSDQTFVNATILVPKYNLPPVTTQTSSSAAGPGGLVSPVLDSVEQFRPTGFKLTWSIDNSADVFSYQIKMKAGSNDWESVVRDLPRQASFTEINGLIPGTKYRFIVVAVYSGRRVAESEPSRRIKLDPDFESDYEVPVAPSTTTTTNQLNDETLASNINTTIPTTTSATTLSQEETALTTSNTKDLATRYACQGSNMCRPPHLILQLVNQTRTAGVTINSLCMSAHADDEYTWFKNTEMIVNMYGKYEIAMEGSSMSILNAQPRDSGWYTCQVSNEYGSNFTRAYIHVIDTNPNQQQTTPITTTASVPVTKPTDRVVNSMQGMVEPPVPEVKALSSSEVLIEWEPISGGVPVDFYKIQYRELGQGSRTPWITLDGAIRGQSTFKVADLTSGGAYKFRLAAVYVNGEHKISDSTVKIRLPTGMKPTTNQEPPTLIPRLILARQTRLTELTIKWLYDGENAERFIVQYKRNTASENDWIEFPVEISNPDDMKEMQVAITNLELNTWYMLRVMAENAKGRSLASNTLKRQVVENFAPGVLPTMSGGDKPKHLSNGSNSDINYIDSSVNKSEISDNTLYLVLGAVLGSVVLILIILVAVCGVKQRQQRRAMLALRGNPDKFADASKVLHMKSQNMNGSQQQQFMLNGPLATGPAHVHSNGTLSSIHSHSKEPRMSLNINPLDEMNEDYHDATLPVHPSMVTDYNLMQHYPHYNSHSRNTPSIPGYHQSQNSLASHQDGSLHHQSNYSHGSLPHHNMMQQGHMRSATPPQFSTFLPRASPASGQEGPTHPAKLPHPHALRPSAYRAQSPMSNRSETPSGGQKRRRRKRSSPRGDNFSSNHTNTGSGREYITTTDLSSADEASAMLDGDGHYTKALPPPPVLPNYNQMMNRRNLDSD